MTMTGELKDLNLQRRGGRAEGKDNPSKTSSPTTFTGK